MELRQVRYFLAVVETGSFSRAAERLTIVQSAVSQQIARLERDLGVALFDRSRRSVRLTRAGLDLVPAARALLRAEDDLRRAVSGQASAARITVGVTQGLDSRLHAALRLLREGGTAVATVAVSPAERVDRVLAGTVDVAVLHGANPRSDLLGVEVRRDRLTVVVGTDHPLAAGSVVALADLAPWPLVLQAAARGTALAEVVVRRCRDAGFEPRVLPDDGAGALAALSANPDAWSVYYEQRARVLDADMLGLRFLPVDDAQFAVPVTVVARPDRAVLAQRFARALTAAG